MYSIPVGVYMALAFLSPGYAPRLSSSLEYSKPPVTGRVIAASNADDTTLIVKRCADFPVTGDGANQQWVKTTWHALTKIDSSGPVYGGRFKMLYSDSGIYVLFNGEDRRITTTILDDMGDVYEGDAFEVFFWPDTARAVYFEYEISPIEKQLVLALAKSGKKHSAWGLSSGRIDRKVVVAGGAMKPDAAISGWTAEFFFPYEVVNLVSGLPPHAGSTWCANLCRLDYDNGRPPTKWSWSPGIIKSFHELEHFRVLRFE